LIIPAYNEENELSGLIKSIQAQTVRLRELILVDDGSTDRTVDMAADFFTVLTTSGRRGPAAARNIGMNHARGDYLAFIDADCRPYSDWIEQIEMAFSDANIYVITGGTRVYSRHFLGQCIAGLGFPGGGALGFTKMWRVAEDGAVPRLSSGNFAMRRQVFLKHGGFDETFDYYCEDAWFAQKLNRSGFTIYYVPEIDIRHAAINNIFQFVRWHLNRGKGNYIFKQKMGRVGDFIKLRIWSTKNMIKAYYRDIRLPFMLVLLGLSFVCQQIGYMIQKRKTGKT